MMRGEPSLTTHSAVLAACSPYRPNAQAQTTTQNTSKASQATSPPMNLTLTVDPCAGVTKASPQCKCFVQALHRQLARHIAQAKHTFGTGSPPSHHGSGSVAFRIQDQDHGSLFTIGLLSY